MYCYKAVIERKSFKKRLIDGCLKQVNLIIAYWVMNIKAEMWSCFMIIETMS